MGSGSELRADLLVNMQDFSSESSPDSLQDTNDKTGKDDFCSCSDSQFFVYVIELVQFLEYMHGISGLHLNS